MNSKDPAVDCMDFSSYHERIRRSLELIRQSDATLEESADLLIMFNSALLDAAATQDQYSMFSVPRNEELQPCAIPWTVSPSRAD